MTPERWQEIRSALDSWLERSLDQRAAWLDNLGAQDPELRREVESLIDFESQADTFLDEPALPLLNQLDPEDLSLGDSGIPIPGLRIGPYRVLEMIGQGGMGAVYRAVREDDFEMQVALKIVQRASTQLLRRFRNERQILARLEHPHIAHLLDGGTSETGLTYLVMEYVDGLPLDVYCHANHLNIRDRLLLFRQICSAVAFAHRNLVIHRDLKPHNILVTESGDVKLLDFGIAKLLETRGIDSDHLLTRTTEQPMTPLYASPEQISRGPVSTASDIYALGVLLYKLLTGRLPCDLEGCSYEELAQRILHQDPVRPSVVVKQPKALVDTHGAPQVLSPETISHARDTDPSKLRRMLAGDLDAILLKALRKEPTARFDSVEQLDEDIERFLSGLPVRARHGNLTYLWGKWFRRHRYALLMVWVILLTFSALVVREFRNLAAEKERAEEVAEFLKGMLEVFDPDERDAGVDAQTVLEHTREQLETMDPEPELGAELFSILARLYYKRGLFDESLSLSSRSLDLWRQAHPEDHSKAAVRLTNLGASFLEQSSYAEAESLFRQALEMQERLGLGDTFNASITAGNLATSLLYRGELDEAEALYRRNLDRLTATYGPDHPNLTRSLKSLGALLHTRGRFAEAETSLRQALSISLADVGPGHPLVASVLDQLGRVRFAREDDFEAERLFQQALEIRRRRLGHEHAQVARTERNLAELMIHYGELDTARVLLRRSQATLRLARPANDWRIADMESILGSLWVAEGDLLRAEPCLRDGYEKLSLSRGEENLSTQAAKRRLAELETVLDDTSRKEGSPAEGHRGDR